MTEVEKTILENQLVLLSTIRKDYARQNSQDDLQVRRIDNRILATRVALEENR